MDEKTISLLLKILKIFVVAVLIVATTISLLGATLISVARNYLESEEFKTQVETTNLATVTFKVNGSKITVSDFVKLKVADYFDEKNWNYSPFVNYTVEMLVSSDNINNTIKSEVYYLVDYFLNTPVDEAKKRVKDGVTILNNEEFNPENAETINEAVGLYARKIVLESIEKTSGVSTDRIIVLISTKTVAKLITVAIICMVILLALNRKTIFNNLLYGGTISLLYGIVIKSAQSKFEEMNSGLEDLVGYVFLKPLADAYSPNALAGIIVGILLFIAFTGIWYLFKNQANKKDEAEELPYQTS